jgi:5-methylcytosine-specific restriction enzyme A
MATYLFAWNPAIWNWPELASDIRTLTRRGHLDTRWSCGRHRNIEPGSRAFLVRLGLPPKGIFGSGVTFTAPEAGRHWIEEKAAAGIPTNYVTLRLDTLFATPLVTFDELAVPPFRRFRWGVRSSGTYLPETIADALEDLWEARAAAVATPRVEAPRRAGSPPRRAAAKAGR